MAQQQLILEHSAMLVYSDECSTVFNGVYSQGSAFRIAAFENFHPILPAINRRFCHNFSHIGTYFLQGSSSMKILLCNLTYTVHCTPCLEESSIKVRLMICLLPVICSFITFWEELSFWRHMPFSLPTGGKQQIN